MPKIEIELPDSLNVPSDNISDYSLLISGEKKIGKTAFCAQFPEHFILEFEPMNASHLRCRFLDIPSWIHLKKAIEKLEANPGYCQTLILDDVPTAFDLCQTYVCDDLGIDNPSDLGYAKGWNALKLEFSTVLDRIQRIGCGVIYTSHTKTIDVETRSGKKFQRLETSLTGTGNKILEAITHLWAVMQYERGERVLYVRGNEYMKAGCGFEKRFQTPDGKILDYIPLGNSAKEGYDNFCKAFRNELQIEGMENEGVNGNEPGKGRETGRNSDSGQSGTNRPANKNKFKRS